MRKKTGGLAVAFTVVALAAVAWVAWPAEGARVAASGAAVDPDARSGASAGGGATREADAGGTVAPERDARPLREVVETVEGAAGRDASRAMAASREEERAPRLRGRVLVDEGIATGQLLVGRPRGAARGFQALAKVGRDGAFELAMPGGLADVWLAGEGWMSAPLELARGVGAHACELGTIDLTGAISVTRLTLLSQSGGELGWRASVQLCPADPSAPSVGGRTHWRGGALLHAPEGCSIEVTAPGHRRRRVELRGGSQTVQLEPALVVSVTVAGLEALPAGVPVEVVLEEPDGRRWRSVPVAQARALSLDRPGAWRARVVLFGALPPADRADDADPVLEVRDVAVPQAFEIALPSWVVSAARERAARR